MSDTAVILSTTPTLEGRPIAEYLGLVTGEAVVAAGLNNFFANLQSAIADPRGHLERLFHEARGLLVTATGTAVRLA